VGHGTYRRGEVGGGDRAGLRHDAATWVEQELGGRYQKQGLGGTGGTSCHSPWHPDIGHKAGGGDRAELRQEEMPVESRGSGQ
jgi:hypothetical protein